MNNPQPPKGGFETGIKGKRRLIMEELEKTMYFGATPEIMERARILRTNMTIQENILWCHLSNRQICNKRFRRQHPIDIFIADFYCHAARLVVEIDGEIHIRQKEYDEGRSAEMDKYYIKVIRFTNKQIETEIEDVINKIANEVKNRIESPPWGI
jgi:very-short-patch-repair endonuclease